MGNSFKISVTDNGSLKIKLLRRIVKRANNIKKSHFSRIRQSRLVYLNFRHILLPFCCSTGTKTKLLYLNPAYLGLWSIFGRICIFFQVKLYFYQTNQIILLKVVYLSFVHFLYHRWFKYDPTFAP